MRVECVVEFGALNGQGGTMRIGELARRTGCAVETIRYYEKAGLLDPPGRTQGNYRAYGEAHVERVRFIRHCRTLDMTLEEIRTLLVVRDDPGASCAAVNALLDEHIGHVAARIDELHALETQLRALRERCAQPKTGGECGILRELARPARSLAPSHAHVHVDGAHRRARG